MANEEHLKLLKQGVEVWNAWRAKEPSVRPDLTGAELREANLNGAFLSGANLTGADLQDAILSGADLSGANLNKAFLGWTNLSGANLSRANFGGANLSRSDISKANLSEANLHRAELFGANLSRAKLDRAVLSEANLTRATLVETSLVDTILTNCRIFGIAAWDLKLSEGTKQQNLIMTPLGESDLTVDDLEVAQFLYLLLHNEKIRSVIDTVGKKGVLLLGRFTEGRIVVLERLRDELRKRGYAPPKVLVFDGAIRLKG